MAHILMVGLGNIGSRWLQGLQPIAEQISRLSLVEMDAASLSRAVAQAGDMPLGEIRAYKQLSHVDRRDIDIAIVATTSAVRREIARQLLDDTTCRHIILEKFLFPARTDYASFGPLASKSSTQIWVNTPRRVWGGYRRLKENLYDAEWVDLRVQGGDRYPLGTTAIHYLDAWYWLMGEPTFDLDGTAVESKLLPSKRQGTVEMGGILTGKATGGGRIEIGCRVGASFPLLVEVLTPSDRWLIDEGRRSADRLSSSGRESIEFEAPFQSELTSGVVFDLLVGDTCALPEYVESSRLHLAILNALLPAYRIGAQQPAAESIPIT